MRNRIMVLTALALACLLMSGCLIDIHSFDWDDYRFEFSDSFAADLEGITELEIEVLNGRINVETWDINRVEIDIEERIKAADEESAEALADATSLKGETRQDTLSLSLDYGDMYEDRKKYACILEIKIPRRMSLNLKSRNGKIAIADIEGDVVLSTTNGSLTVSGAADVRLNTTNGSITAEAVRGSLDAETTNGSINAVVLSGPAGLTTTNGKVVLEVAEQLRGDISVSTTNGAISFIVADGSSFTVDAGTTNGRIRGDLPGADLSYNRRGTSAEGSVGEGEYRVRLSTTNGGIELSGK